ncbi:YdcF family protein [Deinococcus soli (ex Cha et al. 2016)]|uniref:YdcF family protein n=1 Tax=Deinococcus soli (ex Cha et al. 2016) TaxID=1309411 RepID=UPI0016669449|nr:YdcF family protein [Deinococcus soli (ex Cha et al. 2016)]
MTGQRWRNVAGGVAVGAGLAVLAAFLGEVRAPAGLLVGLIGAGGVAGAFRPSWAVLRVGAGALAVLIATCLLTPVLRTPLQSLTLREPPVKADAIVALGAGVHCGSRELEASAVARLTGALALWRAGYAPVVTVSEQSGLIGPRDCPKMSVLETELTRALYGPGGPTLVTLKNVTTTRDEAARVRDLARARGWTRVLLVTSPSHSRRAAALFRSQGVTVVSVPAQEWRFDQALTQPSDRLVALRVLLYEGLSRVKAALGGTPER